MDKDNWTVEWIKQDDWLDHRERVTSRRMHDTLQASHAQALEAEKREIDLYFKAVSVKAKLVDSIVGDHLGRAVVPVRFLVFPQGFIFENVGHGCFSF